MVLRQIELNEDIDRQLAELAEQFGGDVGQALAEVLESRKGVEAFVDQCEEIHTDSLLRQRESSERAFRDGDTVGWDDIKRRNAL